MANTVHGPFTAINVVNGSTPANATWGNNAQTQASIALNGLNGDVWSSFILSGCTPTKDGTVANQLDIASGIAYLRMNDNSVARCDVAATTFTTSTPSTTYYLDLNPDGTWSWGTAHSGVANYQLIAQCTTDGSGNISVVTDNRGPGGMPGVPYVVARVTDSHVTATTDQVALTFTPSVRGFYRASMYLYYSNSTPQKIIASVHWWDVHVGTFAANFFLEMLGGQWLNGAQATTPGTNQGIALTPMPVYAEAGHAINVHFQDPGGVPNDYVTAIIERLA